MANPSLSSGVSLFLRAGWDINSGIPLHINGETIGTTYIPLYLMGAYKDTGAITLAIPDTHGESSGNIKLYTHGY